MSLQCYNLNISINFCIGKVGHPVAHDGSIPPLEQDAKSPPEVSDGFPLKLPHVPRQCTPQLLHLLLCTLVPAAKGFCYKGEEGSPL